MPISSVPLNEHFVPPANTSLKWCQLNHFKGSNDKVVTLQQPLIHRQRVKHRYLMVTRSPGAVRVVQSLVVMIGMKGLRDS